MSTEDLSESIIYLAFLEEMNTMQPWTVVEAPGLGALRPRPTILKRKFVRARFSGIRESMFQEMLETVGLAGDNVLTADQRRRRAAALRGSFERFPIPVIDLFWASDDEAARRRREGTMRPHHWFRLTLLPRDVQGAREPVFIGEPSAGRPVDPDFESGRLSNLRALSVREEAPLRDIFSLAHIPDEDFEEGPEGPTSAPPPDGGDGPEGGSVEARSDEGQEGEIAELARDATYRAMGGPSTDRDDPQFVTISQ